MRAAIYARLSVAGDADETGVDRQIRDSRAHAERLGATSVVEYVDDGISAFNKRTKRPEFERLLDDVDAGRVDLVVAWRTDRLARQGIDAERLIGAAENHKARIVSVADGLDTDSPTGDFILRLFVQVGHWESKGIGTRVRRAHEAIAEQGRPSGGPRAFGHTLDRREIVPEEAEALRDAADRLLAGESAKSVLRDWNGRGLVTPRGNPWQHTAFVKLLQQPRLVGARELRGIRATGHMPPILDLASWERLCAMLKDPSRRPSNPGGQPTHLLTSLMRCGSCGKPLRAKGNSGKKNGPNYSTYGCTTGCGKVWIKASKTDEYISGLVVAALHSPAIAALVAGDPADASDFAETRRAFVSKRETLTDLEARLLRLQYEPDPEASPEAYRRVVSALRVEVADLERELSRVDDTRALSMALANPDGYWKEADLDQRRTLVKLVFPDITVNRAESIHEFPQRWNMRRITLQPAS